MIDDTINFELLEDWAINYLGQKHKSENLENKTKGQKVKSEFKKLGAKIVQDFPEFLLAKCTDWQNSGYIYQYLWMQFKHKEYKNNPSSISIFIVKDTNKNAAKLLIETEIDEKNAKKSDYETFSRALDKSTSFDNSWYWEDNNETIFDTAMAAINSLHERTSKKVKIVKHIKGPYSNTESKRIINELKAAFKQLIPCYKNIYKYNEQIHEYNIDNKSLKFEQPKNQILYGPPGTGKTYNTVIKAMEIINGEKYDFVDNEQYKDLKKQFDNLKQQGQIECVTFHQSYSYEEFVEGIKPDLKNDKLMYTLGRGIFKEICNSAKELLETKVKYNFKKDNISVYKILIPDESIFQYCIDNNCVAINWGDEIDISDCNTQEEIANKMPETFESRKQCISQLNLFKLWIDKDIKNGKDVIVVIPGSINTIKGIAKIAGNYYFNSETENGHQQRKVEWIRKNINISSENIYNSKFVSPTITGMFNDKINWETFLNLINNNNTSQSSNAVLIIDEINRGNISKIFGELITLIEEDKRETMSVKLPYSQDTFTVPQNLYIIGTMNTSDRSIASIDIALRRRFKFVEMMPRPEKLVDKNNQPLMVKDINLQNLLKTINERISYILDRDHQIGHSYFMNWKNYDMTTLKNVWFDEIMPLLNEYFYSDWDKLQAILGQANEIGAEKSFIVKIKKPNLPYEADCSDEEAYYNFSKKEETNDDDFKMMLENAKLV